MLDMSNLGLLSLGNDSDTTAQYGGTGLAGDVGTMHKDGYGLETSRGTGRRIAKLLLQQHAGDFCPLNGPLRINFLILQDRNGEARRRLAQLIAKSHDRLEPSVHDLTGRTILRCLACDICPTSVDRDERYRCIITSGKDVMNEIHGSFIDSDGVVPVIYSSASCNEVSTNYQTFIERTRYLRRGDYVMSDIVAAPLIFEEIGARENYHLRALTSLVRHHTVVTRPVIAQIHDGVILNQEQVENRMERVP